MEANLPKSLILPFISFPLSDVWFSSRPLSLRTPFSLARIFSFYMISSINTKIIASPRDIFNTTLSKREGRILARIFPSQSKNAISGILRIKKRGCVVQPLFVSCGSIKSSKTVVKNFCSALTEGGNTKQYIGFRPFICLFRHAFNYSLNYSTEPLEYQGIVDFSCVS